MERGDLPGTLCAAPQQCEADPEDSGPVRSKPVITFFFFRVSCFSALF